MKLLEPPKLKPLVAKAPSNKALHDAEGDPLKKEHMQTLQVPKRSQVAPTLMQSA